MSTKSDQKAALERDAAQRRHDRAVDDKYAIPMQPCISLKKKDPALFDVLKIQYEARERGEKIVMEEIMSSKNLCIVPGCTKMSQSQRKCKAHLNGSEPRASHFKNAPVPAPEVDEWEEAGWVKQEEVYPEQAEVIISDSELHTINLLQVIRAKMQADFDAEMITIDRHLGLLTDPVEKMKFVFERVYS